MRTRAQRLFTLLENPDSSALAKHISNAILLLILLGCVTYIMETMEDYQYIPAKCNRRYPYDQRKSGECERRPLSVFGKIERASMYIFTVEYLLRVSLVHTVPVEEWLAATPTNSAKIEETSSFGIVGRTRVYMMRPLNVIDLAAILPFWVNQLHIIDASFGVIRIIRLVRVLRMLKSPLVAESVMVFYDSIAASLPALSILFFFSIMFVVVTGSLAFTFERGKFKIDDELCCDPSDIGTRKCLGCFVRPSVDGVLREVSPFKSVPYGMYWVIVTMTTVGYGDMVPTTTAGRFVAIFVTYSGIVAVALPITVIGNNFTNFYDEMHRKQEQKRQAAAKFREMISRNRAHNVQTAAAAENLSESPESPYAGLSPRRAATAASSPEPWREDNKDDEDDHRATAGQTELRGARSSPTPAHVDHAALTDALHSMQRAFAAQRAALATLAEQLDDFALAVSAGGL